MHGEIASVPAAIRLIRTISRFLRLGGGVLVLAATGLIVAEIVLRQVFRYSLGGVDELAGFVLAIGAAWSFAAVLLDRAHVRIDTIYMRFGRRVRAVADIVALAGTALFSGFMLFYAAQVLQQSLRFGATSQSSLALPKAVPQALWVAGLGWFFAVTLVLLVVCLVALWRRDWPMISRLSGAAQVGDEIDAELELASRRRIGETGDRQQ